MITPSSASSVIDVGVGDEAEAGRAEHDAGQDVADDRRLPQANEHEAERNRDRCDERDAGQVGDVILQSCLRVVGEGVTVTCVGAKATLSACRDVTDRGPGAYPALRFARTAASGLGAASPIFVRVFSSRCSNGASRPCTVRTVSVM